MYTPSMIAAASVAAALHGLGWTNKSGCTLTQLLQRLHQITAIEQDYLHGCLMQIEDMVTATINARAQTTTPAKEMTSTTPQTTTRNTSEMTQQIVPQSASEKVLEHEKAGTPTDVRDVHF
jgi:cyclin D2